MSYPDDVRASVRESERADIRTILSDLVGRHGHELVDINLRACATTEQTKVRPFQRGRIKASEFPDVAEETPRIWFGMYPGALIYICGETGAGKSSILYNVMIHAARNEDLWGIPFTMKRPIKVLYIDPENSGNFDEKRPGLCLDKLNRIGQGKPALLEFHDGNGVNLSQGAHMNDLEETILEEKFDIVILDPIINLFGTKDENDNAEAGAQFTLLKALAKRTNACIIAVHHTGRDGSGIFGRGATARLGASDIGLMLRVRGESEDVDDDYGNGSLRPRTDLVRLQMVKNRLDPGKASIYLRMTGEDRFDRVKFEDWKEASARVGPTAERAPKKVQAEEEIYALLADGSSYSTDAIVAAMIKEHIGVNATRSALAKLVGEGLLTATRGGKGGMTFYRIASYHKPEENADGSLIVSQPPYSNRETIKLPEEGNGQKKSTHPASEGAIEGFMDNPPRTPDRDDEGWKNV